MSVIVNNDITLYPINTTCQLVIFKMFLKVKFYLYFFPPSMTLWPHLFHSLLSRHISSTLKVQKSPPDPQSSPPSGSVFSIESFQLPLPPLMTCSMIHSQYPTPIRPGHKAEETMETSSLFWLPSALTGASTLEPPVKPLLQLLTSATAALDSLPPNPSRHRLPP